MDQPLHHKFKNIIFMCAFRFICIRTRINFNLIMRLYIQIINIIYFVDLNVKTITHHRILYIYDIKCYIYNSRSFLVQFIIKYEMYRLRYIYT